METPKAKKIPKELVTHQDVRIDHYYWLNQRDNEEVIQYLKAENEYLESVMAPTNEFQKELFEEMKSRIKENDNSVPYLYQGYYYQTRYNLGDEYPRHYRWKEDSNADEAALLFNVNEMAEGHEYYQMGGISISPNNQLATFGVDTVSRRIYTLKIKDLENNQLLADTIENTTGSSAYAKDNRSIFYTKRDADTLRAFQVYKHIIGTDPATDELIFEEKDPTFHCGVYNSKSGDYIFIASHSTLSTEVRFIPANAPDSDWKIVHPREKDLEYSVGHFGKHFFVYTNADGAKNFKIMRTLIETPGKENWQEVVPAREDVFLEGFELFNDYLVIEERHQGLLKLMVKNWNADEGKFLNQFEIPFDEETYSVYTSKNLDFSSNQLRYVYTSLTTPTSTMLFNMDTHEKQILKQQEVLGDFDSNNYQSERLWIEGRDGTAIPVSLVYHKNTKKLPNTPLLLYGYGSYGHSMDPYFSSTRLSLLDRGFIFAIAHIRGGEELGRQWYENGKLLKKKNTFFDFIDTAQGLVEKGYTSTKHLYASGGSAGGLLMGAVMNMAPDLFHGIIASVPFVDVVTTMLDDTIPLTTFEYDEWGNPNDEAYYQYMKSYSPYDNVEAKNYPNVLVTTGLHDSQVQYWEPAKWVAKLRELKTDNNLLLLKTDMETGHGGASGRFQRLKELALEYNFLLVLENKIARN